MITPFVYNDQMLYNAGRSDSIVHVSNTELSAFFQRYLWDTLRGVLVWEMPDTWDYDYVVDAIYYFGFIGVINTDKFGVIPQWCTLSGWNVYYKPAYLMFSNPMLKSPKEAKIGVNCSIIHINSDYGGMSDLVVYYGDLMALTCESLGINLLNTKLAYVFGADNKAAAESFKSLYDRISSGDPAVVIDKNLLDVTGKPNWFTFTQGVKNNYIGDLLISALHNIYNLFLRDVGVPSANQDKLERMITAEANSQNAATAIATDNRLDRLKRDIEATKKLFKIDKLSVRWRIDPYETAANTDINALQSKPKSI